MKVERRMFGVFFNGELLCTFTDFDDAFVFLNNRFDPAVPHDFVLRVDCLDVVIEEVPF